MSDVPIENFKAMQRKAWSTFAPLAAFTTPAAAHLVEFAGVQPGDHVLDVACGTGVVAITAAACGARSWGLDLTPELVEVARHNASILEGELEFTEGDAESLPYKDGQFDCVLSQFGHMFAPRPDITIREMLRVLKPGGRIAFSTWPPELMIGRMFALVGKYMPPPAGVAPPPAWGDPRIVTERLGDQVTGIEFHREEMTIPALSVLHYRAEMETSVGPVMKVVDLLSGDPARLAEFRSELEDLVRQYFAKNQVRQSFLMTRAIKK